MHHDTVLFRIARNRRKKKRKIGEREEKEKKSKFTSLHDFFYYMFMGLFKPSGVVGWYGDAFCCALSSLPSY